MKLHLLILLLSLTYIVTLVKTQEAEEDDDDEQDDEYNVTYDYDDIDGDSGENEDNDHKWEDYDNRRWGTTTKLWEGDHNRLNQTALDEYKAKQAEYLRMDFYKEIRGQLSDMTCGEEQLDATALKLGKCFLMGAMALTDYLFLKAEVVAEDLLGENVCDYVREFLECGELAALDAGCFGPDSKDAFVSKYLGFAASNLTTSAAQRIAFHRFNGTFTAEDELIAVLVDCPYFDTFNDIVKRDMLKHVAGNVPQLCSFKDTLKAALEVETCVETNLKRLYSGAFHEYFYDDVEYDYDYKSKTSAEIEEDQKKVLKQMKDEVCAVHHQLNEGCYVRSGCVEPKHVAVFAEASFYDSFLKLMEQNLDVFKREEFNIDEHCV